MSPWYAPPHRHWQYQSASLGWRSQHSPSWWECWLEPADQRLNSPNNQWLTSSLRWKTWSWKWTFASETLLKEVPLWYPAAASPMLTTDTTFRYKEKTQNQDQNAWPLLASLSCFCNYKSSKWQQRSSSARWNRKPGGEQLCRSSCKRGWGQHVFL